MAYRTVGNTVVEWRDDEPFIITMQGEIGPADNRMTKKATIDLSMLRKGCTDDFILHLINHFIERNNQVSLASIEVEVRHIKYFFKKIIDLELFDKNIGVIDEAFLLCVGSIKDRLTRSDLQILKFVYKCNPNLQLFARHLNVDDFPAFENKKGAYGQQIDRILAKALSQASIVRILDLCDSAYESGRIDIGLYSFAHLAFAVFSRPESYRQIRIGDFHCDAKTKQYYIYITQVKTREYIPGKIRYGLNEPLGILLTKQRQHVVATYGHLVAKDDIDKLALFPARRLSADGLRWLHPYANQNFGVYKASHSFTLGYQRALEKRLKQDQLTLGANVLRHTVGTSLAQTGASASTIQAVLKHASDTVCKAYVDIAFHGLIYELSEALRPGFSEHLPGLFNFRSKEDHIKPEKLIRSEDVETGRIEDVGECGNSISCTRAPIVCYSCFRFIPCWDADHSINLKIVNREIDDMAKRGMPFQFMVERAKAAKNQIVRVMNIADRYRDSMLGNS